MRGGVLLVSDGVGSIDTSIRSVLLGFEMAEVCRQACIAIALKTRL